MKQATYLRLMNGAALAALLLPAVGAFAQEPPPTDFRGPPSDVTSRPPSATAIRRAAATGQPRPVARTGVEEVVVTAQRRKERLQDVPISVSVIRGSTLASKGVTSTQDLPTLVSGLTFTTQGPAGIIFLRGVGSDGGNPNEEPPVATYVDGVYVASSFANVSALPNVERVEVLKGPQGTLFGRNATGGVIQVITRDPTRTPVLEVNGGYSNYNTPAGSLYASTGLTEHTAVNLALQGSDQLDGFGRNVTLNKDTYRTKDYSARSKFLYAPTDQLSVILAGDYQYLSNNSVDYRAPFGVHDISGQLPPSNPYDTRSDVTYRNLGLPEVIVRQYGTSLTASYDFGFARLINITAYRHSTGTYHADADDSSLPFVSAELPIYQANESEEIQLQSPAASKIAYTVGFFYYNNDAGYPHYIFNGLAFGNPALGILGTVSGSGVQNTDSKAVFGQATVPLIYATKFTAGLRFTDENLTEHNAIFGTTLPDGHSGFKRLTWRFSLDHAFSDDLHAYISDNRGVKSGGFNVLAPGTEPFAPETLDAYEIGIKSQLFDHHLRLNAAAFDYNYKNIQVQVDTAGSDGGTGIIETLNAAKARIRGVDGDFEWVPLPHLDISGGAAYLDGKYLNYPDAIGYPAQIGPVIVFNASGDRTVRTPKFTGNVTIGYAVQSEYGEFPLSTTVSHNSGFTFNTDGRFRQPSYNLLNASVGWVSPNGRYGITVYGANLTDEYYLAQGVTSALGDLTVPSPPRTYGFNLHMKLGG